MQLKKKKSRSESLHFDEMTKLDVKIFFFLSILGFSGTFSNGQLLKTVHNQIKFELFTINNQTVVQTKIDPENFDAINETIPTKIIIHGWLVNSSTYWIPQIITQLLKREKSNVITIDWSAYSTSINYPLVRRQLKEIGEYVGNFLIAIAKNESKTLEKVHVIGHSLGAHLAGFVGQSVYSKLNKKIGKITGLDAAGPLFELTDLDLRLSGDDADVVDAIHTNGKMLGFAARYGTMDFFPNGGGPVQPGCLTDSCSHSRAFSFYIESVFSNQFIAIKCPSFYMFQSGWCRYNAKAVMGFQSNPLKNSEIYGFNPTSSIYTHFEYVTFKNFPDFQFPCKLSHFQCRIEVLFKLEALMNCFLKIKTLNKVSRLISVKQLRQMSNNTPIENSIRTKLSSLNTIHLDVINESYMHNVPKGAETHFKVVVVTDKFNGLSLIKRHRLVNDLLKDELNNGVHALSIVTKTPDQWNSSDQVVESSPNCRGGFGK